MVLFLASLGGLEACVATKEVPVKDGSESIVGENVINMCQHPKCHFVDNPCVLVWHWFVLKQCADDDRDNVHLVTLGSHEIPVGEEAVSRHDVLLDSDALDVRDSVASEKVVLLTGDGICEQGSSRWFLCQKARKSCFLMSFEGLVPLDQLTLIATGHPRCKG